MSVNQWKDSGADCEKGAEGGGMKYVLIAIVAVLTLPIAVTWTVELLARLVATLGPEWVAGESAAHSIAWIAIILAIFGVALYTDTRR